MEYEVYIPDEEDEEFEDELYADAYAKMFNNGMWSGYLDLPQ